jgi:hypothetical protein
VIGLRTKRSGRRSNGTRDTTRPVQYSSGTGQPSLAEFVSDADLSARSRDADHLERVEEIYQSMANTSRGGEEIKEPEPTLFDHLI